MDYSGIKKEITEYIERNFSEKRKVHTYGVRDTALKLAKTYGCDLEKAELAALFHDMFRGVKVDSLNYYVKHLGLPEKYKDNANLAHGKIAAIIMKRDFDITDEDILNAVSYHTTGRKGMSILEKVIYLADAIEPNRAYPGVDDIRKQAETSLDLACLVSMTSTVNFVRSQGKYLDPDTEEAKTDLERITEGERDNG